MGRVLSSDGGAGQDRELAGVACGYVRRLAPGRSSASSTVSRAVFQTSTGSSFSCFIAWLPQETMQMLPRWHYLHITKDVISAMRSRGVTEEQFDTMLVDKSCKLFQKPKGSY